MGEDRNRRAMSRCGILFDGDHTPFWAESIIRSLVDTCGADQVSYISRREESSPEARLAEFDFVINLSRLPIPQGWGKLARHGVWEYRFGDGTFDGKNFGLPEVWRGRGTQRVYLARAGSPDVDGLVFRRGIFRVVAHSLRQHRASVISQCASWAGLLAEEIARENSTPIVDRFVPAPHLRFKKMRQLAFLAGILLLLPIRKLTNVAAKIRRVFLYQQWNVGLLRQSNLAQVRDGARASVDWLLKPKWPLCYADPFLTFYSGAPHIFVERYDFKAAKGSISAIPIEADNPEASEIIAMDFPFHSSYPCLVEDGSRLYCVPETIDAEQISIYRCEKFPRIWNKVAIVANGARYSDPTLFRHEGRWWVFSTLFDDASEGNSLLHAWYSDDIRGPWTAHLRNPIKCDVGGARSAGTVYSAGGESFRPTQDCTRAYGGSIVIQRIIELTPSTFSEEPFRRILPTAEYPDGAHHVAKLGDVVLIDGRRDLYSLAAPFYKVPRYFRSFVRPTPQLKPRPRLRLVLADLSRNVPLIITEQ